MIALQAISIFFGIFMLYVARIHRKKGLVRPAEGTFWTVVWAVFVLAAFFPDSVRGVVQSLQIARVFDFFVIIAFMVLYYVAYQTRVLVLKFDRKLEQVIRREAIREPINLKN